MRYIITAKHENGHEMKQTRYSKEDVERTINLMKQCGYIEITVQEIGILLIVLMAGVEV